MFKDKKDIVAQTQRLHAPCLFMEVLLVNDIESKQIPNSEQTLSSQCKDPTANDVNTYTLGYLMVSAFLPLLDFHLFLSCALRLFISNLHFKDRSRSHPDDDSVITNTKTLDVVFRVADGLRGVQAFAHIENFQTFERFD